MSRHRDSGSDSKLYVGDLGSSACKQDLEDAFGHYGPLRSVWVARHPPGFAFVEFETARDADDAVRGLDGRSICGRRVRVEPSNGGPRRRGGGGRGPPPRSSRGRPFHPDDKCYQCGDRGHYARDCRRFSRRSRSRSRSRDRRSRSRSTKSRSRSRSRTRRTRSKSRSKTRKTRSKTRSRTRSKSRSSSRSKSADKQNGHKIANGVDK